MYVKKYSLVSMSIKIKYSNQQISFIRQNMTTKQKDKKHNLKQILIFSHFLFLLFVVSTSSLADRYQCNSPEITQKAKKLLEQSGFLIEFCSNCPYSGEAPKRANISKVTVEKLECGQELTVHGKTVRIIKPPVFGGACTDLLEISNPSFKTSETYEQKADLAYMYIFDKTDNQFKTIAEILGLDVSEVCVKHMIIKK